MSRASGSRLAVRSRAAVLVSTALLALAACGGSGVTARDLSRSAASDAAGGNPSASAVSGAVTVFAAASLTEVFERIAQDFHTIHPAVRVALNVGGSSALAQQILAGAPADVFAAASSASMQVVTDAGLATTARVFARNRLQIAVPPDNPGRVTGLADFADEDLKIALCAAQVPCGAAAAMVLATTGTSAAPDTLEPDVKAALSKVQLGEVDAALVYRTDVLAAGDRVRGIAFPAADTAVNDYPVATLDEAPNPVASAAFVDFVLSGPGQQVLADAGFDRP